MTETSAGTAEAERVASELLSLQTKITAARSQGAKFRNLTTVILLLVFVVYGLLIYSMIKKFDLDQFIGELQARATELQPRATAQLQAAIQANQVEAVTRIDAVIQKHMPAFEQAADRELEFLTQDLRAHFVLALEEFAQVQIDKHAQEFYQRFPEMADEQFRAQSTAHLQEVLAMAVNEVMDREFVLIQNDIDALYAVFSLPQVRARIDEIKRDPTHRERLMRSFLSIVAEPFVE